MAQKERGIVVDMDNGLSFNVPLSENMPVDDFFKVVERLRSIKEGGYIEPPKPSETHIHKAAPAAPRPTMRRERMESTQSYQQPQDNQPQQSGGAPNQLQEILDYLEQKKSSINSDIHGKEMQVIVNKLNKLEAKTLEFDELSKSVKGISRMIIDRHTEEEFDQAIERLNQLETKMKDVSGQAKFADENSQKAYDRLGRKMREVEQLSHHADTTVRRNVEETSKLVDGLKREVMAIGSKANEALHITKDLDDGHIRSVDELNKKIESIGHKNQAVETLAKNIEHSAKHDSKELFDKVHVLDERMNELNSLTKFMIDKHSNKEFDELQQKVADLEGKSAELDSLTRFIVEHYSNKKLEAMNRRLLQLEEGFKDVHDTSKEVHGSTTGEIDKFGLKLTFVEKKAKETELFSKLLEKKLKDANKDFTEKLDKINMLSKIKMGVKEHQSTLEILRQMPSSDKVDHMGGRVEYLEGKVKDLIHYVQKINPLLNELAEHVD